MAREHWFMLGAAVIVLLALAKYASLKTCKGPPIQASQTIAYKTVDDEPQLLHAFFPTTNTRAAVPAILLFHGGRWLVGEPRQFYRQCQFFAGQGYACFSAQYRLGKNHAVDVRLLVEDAADALRYLHEHAADLNIDATKIVAGGGSSGGHLAAALGVQVPQLAQRPAPLRPAALVLFNPMLDLSPGTPDYPLVADYWRAVSPQQHIDNAVPPTLILVGSEDPEVPVATARAFCATMEQAGGLCELEIYPGQTHGFFNNEPFLARTNQRVLQFLQSL